jgi:signal transduction histidine kinase/CheY-like chemotaxis protein
VRAISPASRGRRYALAAIAALAAAILQWMVTPVVGQRIPFLFFLIAIGVAGFYAGRGPSLFVLVIGGLNAALQLAPLDSLAVTSVQDRLIIVIYVMAGSALVHVAAHLGSSYDGAQENVSDLERLHELSLALATLPSLNAQLDLILQRLAEMHGTRQGLISFYDRSANRLRVAASLNFSSAGLERLKHVRGGQGACGIACLEQRRVIVEDTEQDACFANFRALAREEGFRSVHSTPLLNHQGDVLGAISLHFPGPRRPTTREVRLAEICARKVVVHMERAEAEMLARDSDQRLRRVVDASAVPFTVLAPVRDASGSIVDFSWTYLNRRAALALRRDAGELIGRRIGEVLPGTWNEPHLFENYVAVALHGEAREFELQSSSNGIEGWFQVVASPLDGNVAVWFADISERKRQEIELRDADRRKDEFLATLAHELRNPLAPIRQAAMIANRPAVTPSQRQWCNELIERQVQHMALLLDDLLDVSRITRGVLTLRRQATTLAALVESAVETTRPLLDSKKHELQVTLADPQAQLWVDPMRMSQVISNLLNNAAKYTNAGGTIRLSAMVCDGGLTLSVADNGIGIPGSELQAIFSMFSQLKAAQDRAEGGLGIGLALTRGLVELHGGHIKAESAGPNAGSTFTISIANVLHAQPESAGTDVRVARPTLCRTILLADDNQDAAESLAVLLRMDGHQVTVAKDGQTALALFEAINPDVALLDLGMPQLSGYEVACRIRNGGAIGRDVLLIAITGWGQHSDRAKSSQAGFDHHITKPVDYAALTELISPNAQRKRLQPAAAL